MILCIRQRSMPYKPAMPLARSAFPPPRTLLPLTYRYLCRHTTSVPLLSSATLSAMASPPNTPPISTPPSVASSPSNHRFFGFPNPRSAAFSLCKDSSPTTRSQPPVSPPTEHESDPQEEDDDSDVEIYLSALSIDNSIEDPTSISLGSIDNSIANDGLFVTSSRSLVKPNFCRTIHRSDPTPFQSSFPITINISA